MQEAAEPRRHPAVGPALQRHDPAAAARLSDAGRLSPTSSSTCGRSSTASCSPTSCCCTWPATSPASRPRATAARSRATWSSGAPPAPTRASASSTSSARASSRRSRFSAPASSPTRPTRSSARSWRSNELRLDDLNRALLRLVYRVLFWFVAEDRDALLHPAPQPTFPRKRGAAPRGHATATHEYFSADRLRQLARRQRGTRHTDLYEAVELVFDALGSEGGVPELALPGIGGIFETGRPGRAPGRRPPHQRGAAHRGPRPGLVQVPRGRPAAPGRLRQPRRGRTRQRSTSPCLS